MKNVVVTGGTKGIGKAIINQFNERGYQIITCSRTAEDCKAIEAEMSNLKAFQTDMSKKEEVLRFGQQVKDHFNQIDILINNAGIFIPGLSSEEEDGALEAMIETNLYSAYYLTRSLLEHIPENKASHIFNMCSIASIMAYPNGGSYSISKFALYGYTKVLREELKPKGIKVTAILPGATWSNSWKGVDLPEERLMQADDVAKSIVVASDLSASAVIEEIVLRPQLGDL